MRSQTPASHHRRNRRCTLLRFPNSLGKSRQGAPVLKIHKTAFINNRLSFAMPPHCPLCPGKIGAKMLHCSSVKSCLCKYLSVMHTCCTIFYNVSISSRRYLEKFSRGVVFIGKRNPNKTDLSMFHMQSLKESFHHPLILSNR